MGKPTRAEMNKLREFLKDDIRLRTDFTQTDQALGVPMPPVQKPLAPGETLQPLPDWRAIAPKASLVEVIEARKSSRKFLDEAISAEELSFLLWATQGVRQETPGRVLRTVPSGGNRHSTETYLALTRPVPDSQGGVAFEAGLYRYAPLQHALVCQARPENLADLLTRAVNDRAYVALAPVIFFWACLPYRTEWRYGECSHKVLALDLGHLCEHLYLAAGAIGCGTCAMAGYSQPKANALFNLDGEEEFITYLAPVGKIR